MTYIRYPQGAGGRWLISLLNQIHGEKTTEEFNFVNFHHFLKKNNYNAGHSVFESGDVILSSNCSFNFFLNFWWKKRTFENYLNWNSESLINQIMLLSDDSRWILYDKNYSQNYIDRIDIEYTTIWQDPHRFNKNLVDFFKIDINCNTEKIINQQLILYKSTCIDPIYHFGNPFSIPWIAWCHAQIVELNMDFDIILDCSSKVPLLSKFIRDNNHLFIEYTKKNVFYYN